MKMNTHVTLLLAALVLLTGCSSVSDLFGGKDKPPLEGERISVLELEESLEPDDATLEAQGLVAPAAWRNEFWPQVGGYPNHSMQNLDLNEGQLKRIWSADIGEGSTGELPLTAQPILVDGRVFTLSTDLELSAFDAQTGDRFWQINVQPEEEDDEVITGGLAYAAGVLYVTNGYDEVLAVKPTDGEIFWRRDLPAPSRAAPTIMDGRLYVATLDNRLIAMDARSGQSLWEYTGLSETAGVIGAASPAANRDIVVPAFSSGEVVALRVENGSIAWSDNLSSRTKRLGGLSTISDIKAAPVIDKGLVIAMSFNSKIVAIDERTGVRVWQREIGGSNMPWVAGNHIFVISADNQLVALSRDNGIIRWVTKLEDGEDSLFYAGPILAGGRLILSSAEGVVIEINPESGDFVRQWEAGNGFSIPPIVASGTLYLLDENGTLSAYQ